MLRANDVHQAITIGKVDGIVAGGIKTDGAFGVQVINRVIKQVTAVRAFLRLYNAVQIYFYRRVVQSPSSVMLLFSHHGFKVK
jgi:hypothetical protein